MPTQTLFKSRQYAGEADVPEICDLLNRCDAVDKLDDNYDVESLRVEFTSPDLDIARDLRLWEDEQGRVVGFGQVWIPKEGDVVHGFSYVRIDPEARNNGLESEIMQWAEERVRGVGQERGLPAQLYGRTPDYDTYGRGIFEAHGMSIVRYGFRMVRDLSQSIPEPTFPEGYTLTHTQGIPDAEKWVECFNQSFIDHWLHHPETVEGHAHWLTNPHYRKEHDLVAIAPDGTFAAFSFCGIDPEDNARNNRKDGWIHILGTKRGHRKKGLGTAMLRAGMLLIKQEGMENAKLGVDAENPTGALRLYEANGFVVQKTGISYCKDL